MKLIDFLLIIIMILMFSCSVAWGHDIPKDEDDNNIQDFLIRDDKYVHYHNKLGKTVYVKYVWDVPLNGEFCVNCNFKAIDRGYLGRPLCKQHKYELALYTLLPPTEAERAIKEGKSPQEVIQEINSSNNWANSVQKSQSPTIEELQKEIDQLKNNTVNLQVLDRLGKLIAAMINESNELETRIADIENFTWFDVENLMSKFSTDTRCIKDVIDKKNKELEQ